jgi:hypothetical protein
MITADTFIRESDAGTNFGTRDLLEVDNSPRKYTFIRVVVTGVGSAQVTSARLRLRVADEDGADSNSGGRIHLQPNCNWSETGLTWNNRSSAPFSSTVLSSVGTVSENQVVEFNVTSAVAGDGTYCFVIDTTSSNGVDYNSREASPSSVRPTFVIQVSAASTTTTSTTSTTVTTSTTTTTTQAPTTTTSSTTSTTTQAPTTTTTSTTSTTTQPPTTTTSSSTTTTSTTTTSSTLLPTTTTTTSTTTTSTTLCIPTGTICLSSSTCCTGACTAGTCQGTTYRLEGAAGELSPPGFPFTPAEAQELSKLFADEYSVSLIYDPANTTFSSGIFHYDAPSDAAALEIVVSNTTGTTTYSFGEYRLFVDDTTTLDQLVFTPFLPADTTVTLSTSTAVPVDIGLVWQDPHGTTLSSSSTLPSALDLSVLNIRGISFIFLNSDDLTGNGSIKGALRRTICPAS